MGKDGFYPATHSPNEVKWRPVTRRKTIPSPEGPVIAEPGKHVELLEEVSGANWVNSPVDFWRRYGPSLKGEALEAFMQNYPGIAK